MGSPRLDGLRVLFVDDRKDARYVVDHILRDAGASVVLAENGMQALSTIANARGNAPLFDVIVMDVEMPVMDGLSATRRLRLAGIQQPVLALTAGNMEEDRRECLAAGCDEYLSKPIDGLKLVRTVHRLSQGSNVPC